MKAIKSRTLPIGLLAAAGFLSSSGARVVDSLLDVIARDFHVGIPLVAIVLAAFTLPYGMLQLVIGPVADRVGKARVLTWALVAYAAATTGCAFAPNLQSLTLLRAVSGGASAGLIPVCLAYIADATAYHERQVTLSRFLGGVVFAQILAGPIGGAFGQFITWRGVFLLLAAAALVLAASAQWYLHRLPAAPSTATPPRSYTRLVERGPRNMLLLTAWDGVVFTGTVPFIAPFLHEEFGLSYVVAGLVLACFGLGTLIYIRTAKRMIPLLGERGLVIAGGIVGALGMALAAAAGNPLLYVPAEVLLGLGYFMLHSVLQARATELLPNARSTATSGFAFMLFMGQALGALLCARGIEAIGYRAVFAADAGAMLLLGIMLWRLFRVAAD
jgi:predicted MFS family arabinose efflux permease